MLHGRLQKAEDEGNVALKTRLQQCLQFIRDETAFNLLVGATTGVVYTAHAQMNWHEYDENQTMFIMAAAFWATELLLNGAAERYESSVQKRSFDLKTELINRGIPAFLANLTTTLSLYFLWPNYTEESFLLAALGTQAMRQILSPVMQATLWLRNQCFNKSPDDEVRNEEAQYCNKSSDEGGGEAQHCNKSSDEEGGNEVIYLLTPCEMNERRLVGKLMYTEPVLPSSFSMSHVSDDYPISEALSGEKSSMGANGSYGSVDSSEDVDNLLVISQSQPSSNASFGWAVANSLLAMGATVGVVATTYFLMDLAEDERDGYTSGDNIALNASIGGVVGVGIVVAGRSIWEGGLSFFNGLRPSSTCCSDLDSNKQYNRLLINS